MGKNTTQSTMHQLQMKKKSPKRDMFVKHQNNMVLVTMTTRDGSTKCHKNDHRAQKTCSCPCPGCRLNILHVHHTSHRKIILEITHLKGFRKYGDKWKKMDEIDLPYILVLPYISTRTIWSQDAGLLIVSRISKQTAGGRAFSYRAQFLWNGRPIHVRDMDSVSTFKSLLKTRLLSMS